MHANNGQDCFNGQRKTDGIEKVGKNCIFNILSEAKDIVNYFEEEYYRFKLVNEEKTYKINVSNYYKMVDRDSRNYRSLRKFCGNRDNGNFR